ncbi:NACHT domain-containing protein [Limnospira platensis]|uniref:NACHT domain-containing protein n=2 Tax=Oscillatoriales TaxID=1150 RepID=UPI003D6DD3F1
MYFDQSYWRTQILKIQQDDVVVRLHNSLHSDQLISRVAKPEAETNGRIPQLSLTSSLNPGFREQWRHQLPEHIFTRKEGEEPQQTVLEIFKVSQQKLLILGKPGIGKTTLLLKLARDLIKIAEEDSDSAIPIVFELATLNNPKQSIDSWLVEDLKNRYNLPRFIAKKWLKNGKILPLIDGLQQVPFEKLSEFFNVRDGVVCCRDDHYLQSGKTIDYLQGLVYLQPLTAQEIHNYLHSLDGGHIWEVIQNDKGLLTLASIPLFLDLITVIYGENLYPQIDSYLFHNNDSDISQLQSDLLDIYISQRLTKNLPNTPDKSHGILNHEPVMAKRYLRWLAKRMQAQNQSEFVLHQIQHNFLGNKLLEFIYLMIIVFIAGAIIGIFISTINHFLFDVFSSVFMGLISGILANDFNPHFLNYGWSKIKKGVIFAMVGGIITALIAGIMGQFIYGLIYGLMAVLIIVALFPLTQMGITHIKYPNQPINQAAKNSLMMFCLACPIGINLSMLYLYINGEYITILSAIIPGIAIALMFSLCLGGVPVIEHYSLRWFLLEKKVIPWNYVEFLNQACDRQILQRVGGRYRFVHDLLLEHLAG